MIALGRDVGLTSQVFVDAVHDDTYVGHVEKVDEDASKRGVTGTPTVLVDGRGLAAQELSPDGFAAAVATAAAR